MALGDNFVDENLLIKEVRQQLNLTNDLPENLEERIRKVCNEILDERSVHIDISFLRKKAGT